MPARFSRRPHDPAAALAQLADWLETCSIHTDEPQRVLVLGAPDATEIVAAWFPDADVVTGRYVPAGDGFDLVAVIDVGAGPTPAELLAAAAATRASGTLLVVLHAGADGSLVFSSAAWDPAAAGLRLVALDDLDDRSGTVAGAPHRWLRATYRRANG